MKRFLEGVVTSHQRQGKPRTRGLTMVIDAIGSAARSPYVQAVADYIDRVKLTQQTIWVPEDVVVANIRAYRDLGIDVQMGGVPFELATLQDREEEYARALVKAGANVIEVESHAAGLSVEDMQRSVERFKKMGLKVVAEAGAKWPLKDDTRVGRDAISVEKTVRLMRAVLDAGADHVYWEGQVIRCLIGTTLENQEGQAQLKAVAESVGAEHITFEVLFDRFGVGGEPFAAWLVYEFGPDVNLGNLAVNHVLAFESIRRGTYYEMDHPYLRWLEEGKPVPEWWRMEPPDYDVDVNRGFVLKERR